MHCDVLRRVTFDLVLRFVQARMDGVPFELNPGRDHSNNRPANVAGFRIPPHMIALAERPLRHYILLLGFVHATRRLSSETVLRAPALQQAAVGLWTSTARDGACTTTSGHLIVAIKSVTPQRARCARRAEQNLHDLDPQFRGTLEGHCLSKVEKRRMRPGSKPIVRSLTYEIDVAVPYRLDLTVSALRRLSANIVDVFTPDGQYIRAFGGPHEPLIARVTQKRPDMLSLTLDGDAGEHPRAIALMRRMLGVDRELTHFNRAAARISWLRPLARRMLGVKPPRYPSLWEACVNSIVFQQVSLHAASAILRKIIVVTSPALSYDGNVMHAFPSAESVQRTEDGVLLGAGLSGRKLATLRRVGDALLSGMLDEIMLEERASSDAIELLCRVKGIGPWTATVILLRGLGRLDVFPMNDSSVARNLTLVAGDAPLDVEGTLRALGPQKGMLYYHLLLARLETRDDVGRASAY